MHGVNPLCIAAQSSQITSSRNVIGQRTESDRTADGIRLDGGRNLMAFAALSGGTLRGCTCLKCTNKADRHVRSVGALLTRLVHLRQVHPLRDTNICVDL